MQGFSFRPRRRLGVDEVIMAIITKDLPRWRYAMVAVMAVNHFLEPGHLVNELPQVIRLKGFGHNLATSRYLIVPLSAIGTY